MLLSSPSRLVSFLALLVASTSATPVTHKEALPIVDLGYVKQQASSYNSTGGYYYFNNIAFAQPPTGELRWSAPLPPKYSKDIKSGRFPSPQCPQANPAWLAGMSPHDPIPAPNPTESEDCLYLDIVVPKKIFEQKDATAPVLTWIYGGGNVVGSKQGFGSGNGLVQRSMQTTKSDGVIFIALNYRLGAFAFLEGDLFKKQGGVTNLALLDQRLALDWIQKNICKFGGDANRVTVIGESGGGGAIGHHLIAPENESGPPFQQAIFQSPADFPELPANSCLNTQFTTFLKEVNASSLEEARALDTATLQSWNRQYNWVAPQGRFLFMLSNDNNYVVDSLYHGLAAGRFDHGVKVLTAHNSNEGAIFTPNLTNFNFRKYVESYTAQASKTTIDYITNDLYPARAFQDSALRANAFFGDMLIGCLPYSIQRAFGGQGPAYLFAVPPGYHIQDLSYTFFDNGTNPTDIGFGPTDPTVAVDMQTYFVNFAAHGDPNAGSKLPTMPKYGKKGNMLQLAPGNSQIVPDPSHNQRCEFWATYMS